MAPTILCTSVRPRKSTSTIATEMIRAANPSIDICAAMIKSKTAIKDVPTHLSHCGMPIIEGALATFECNLEVSHDAGDHVIVVGRVTKAHHRGGDPLVFHAGKYGEFTAT